MRFELEGHLLDLDRRELRRGDACVAVEPQVLDLLAHLVRNRDRVVSKDELIATVWAGRIVSDSTLDSRINAARRALGDSGEDQRFIRTYSRKGIRYVGVVRDGSALPVAGAVEPLPRPGPHWRGKPCLAVLPFANLGADPEQDYFSDGITEDIITELSRNRSLLLVARNSSFSFRSGGGVDVREIGRALGADYVVEGSVRRLGTNIRLTVELAETEGGLQLWAERYDRGIEGIFEVQDHVVRTIAARLDPEVVMAEQHRAARKPRQSFDAWDYFRLGTRAFYCTSAAANREAQQCFRRAIELDPDLAQAHGFLSYAIVLSMIYFDAEPDAEVLAEAVSIARRGVELDDRDAMARFMHGRALLARGAYGEAVAELEAARDMNPSLAVVHCGIGDSLAYEGRIREAIPHFQTAINLSPHDPFRWAFLSYRALAHLFGRDFENAAEWARRATRIPNCHYWGFAHRVSALGHLGSDTREALEELRKANPAFSQALARQRLFYVKHPGQVALYLEGLAKAGVPAR